MNLPILFNKLRVLFIVTSFWASGEFMIAREFAKNLKKSGHEVAFVLPPSHYKKVKSIYKAYGLIPKSRKLNQLLFQEIAYSFQPDILILSDFLNYHFASNHYGIIKEDLEILGGKIATFDNYNWLKTRVGMDTYGFYSSIPRELNIQDYGARIIPCPLENPDSLGQGNYAYALCQEVISRTEKEKNKIYQGFNLDPNKKIIFLTSASWQENAVQERKVQQFMQKVDKLYQKIIQDLKDKYQIVLVGTNKKILGEEKNIHYYSNLDSQHFDDLISIADLYIGRNLISTSMVRMVLSGLRCLCLVNGKKVSRASENYAYRFRMFPVGWYDFLTPLVEKNPYYDLIEMMEIFTEEGATDRIHTILEEDPKNYEERLDGLKSKLANLNTPSQIVCKLAKEESSC